MRDAWRIGPWMHVRLTSSEASPPEATAMHSAQAAMWIRWLVDAGPQGRELLLDIAEALSGGFSSPRADVEAALAIVRRGFEEGRLQAFEQHHKGGGKGPEQDERPQVEAPREDPKTFIAVELVSDEPEPKPVPFKRYRVVLPDESVREGRLDQFGRALITGIDPGSCKVSFPDFDAADWKAA